MHAESRRTSGSTCATAVDSFEDASAALIPHPCRLLLTPVRCDTRRVALRANSIGLHASVDCPRASAVDCAARRLSPRAHTRTPIMGGSLSKALGVLAQAGASVRLRRAQASSLATRRCASSCSGSMRRARRVRGPRWHGSCLSSRVAILYKLKLDQSVTTIPTVGLCVWSCGCRPLIRQQRRDSDGS